jgi:hypothetical protein
MPNIPCPSEQPARRLLTGDEVRAAAKTGAPGYGERFTEADWERIAERLEALARLFWEFSQRRTREETRDPKRE